ncbi:hypothetical protein DT23_05110 [Thioclava indica]|uniref:Uncharacterized protein n=1 Tax=Thioclava indica TaxID=1353528 RepID=A0A074JIJ9_9RHOB|nr:hypothetical protein DT23_05110 [Thioclava indica]
MCAHWGVIVYRCFTNLGGAAGLVKRVHQSQNRSGESKAKAGETSADFTR